MSEKEEEFVELTVKVPKPVMDLFRAYWKFVGYTDLPEDYLVEHVNSNLPSFIADLAIPADGTESIIGNYGLEPYRELMGFPKHKEAEAR